jgi:hypothetical protein
MRMKSAARDHRNVSKIVVGKPEGKISIVGGLGMDGMNPLCNFPLHLFDTF